MQIVYHTNLFLFRMNFQVHAHVQKVGEQSLVQKDVHGHSPLPTYLLQVSEDVDVREDIHHHGNHLQGRGRHGQAIRSQEHHLTECCWTPSQSGEGIPSCKRPSSLPSSQSQFPSHHGLFFISTHTQAPVGYKSWLALADTPHSFSATLLRKFLKNTEKPPPCLPLNLLHSTVVPSVNPHPGLIRTSELSRFCTDTRSSNGPLHPHTWLRY